MLHSGLRSGEIRRLRLADLSLQACGAKIAQSKGLKDRLVCLSPEAAQALRGYLAVQGPASSEHLFLYRHQP
jgi:integrase